MRLTFANFDPGPSQPPGQGPSGSPADSSFEEVLKEHLGASPHQIPARSPVQVGDLAAMSMAVLRRDRVEYQDVAEFLELYATEEFVFPAAVLDLIRAASDKEPRSAQREPAGEAPPVREEARRQADLLLGLIRQGLVSQEDVCSANTTVYPNRDGAAGYLLNTGDFLDIRALPKEDYDGRLQAMCHNERFAFDHLRQEYGKTCASILKYEKSHQNLRAALRTAAQPGQEE